MTHILSLIANPAMPVLTPDLLRTIGAPVDCSDFTVLAAGVAVEWQADAQTPVEHWRRLMSEYRVDVNVIPAIGRQAKLLIADMDSTMIEQECIDELADFAGLKAEIAAITERAMRGELDFEDALRARVARLAGLGQEVIARTLADKITYMPGGKILIATMKARGAHTALVSGGFDAFTAVVAAHLGFETHRANHLDISDGKIAGTVRHPILGRSAKAAILQELATARALDLDDCMAVGDGANDLAMIGLAGLGVAYRAKPATAAAARYNLSHGDLTGLLYLQGIKRADHTGD